MNGTVHGSGGVVYLICLASGELLEASLRGRLKKEARTGDRVVMVEDGDVLSTLVRHDDSLD